MDSGFVVVVLVEEVVGGTELEDTRGGGVAVLPLIPIGVTVRPGGGLRPSWLRR